MEQSTSFDSIRRLLLEPATVADPGVMVLANALANKNRPKALVAEFLEVEPAFSTVFAALKLLVAEHKTSAIHIVFNSFSLIIEYLHADVQHEGIAIQLMQRLLTEHMTEIKTALTSRSTKTIKGTVRLLSLLATLNPLAAHTVFTELSAFQQPFWLEILHQTPSKPEDNLAMLVIRLILAILETVDDAALTSMLLHSETSIWFLLFQANYYKQFVVSLRLVNFLHNRILRASLSKQQRMLIFRRPQAIADLLKIYQTIDDSLPSSVKSLYKRDEMSKEAVSTSDEEILARKRLSEVFHDFMSTLLCDPDRGIIVPCKVGHTLRSPTSVLSPSSRELLTNLELKDEMEPESDSDEEEFEDEAPATNSTRRDSTSSIADSVDDRSAVAEPQQANAGEGHTERRRQHFIISILKCLPRSFFSIPNIRGLLLRLCTLVPEIIPDCTYLAARDLTQDVDLSAVAHLRFLLDCATQRIHTLRVIGSCLSLEHRAASIVAALNSDLLKWAFSKNALARYLVLSLLQASLARLEATLEEIDSSSLHTLWQSYRADLVDLVARKLPNPVVISAFVKDFHKSFTKQATPSSSSTFLVYMTAVQVLTSFQKLLPRRMAGDIEALLPSDALLASMPRPALLRWFNFLDCCEPVRLFSSFRGVLNGKSTLLATIFSHLGSNSEALSATTRSIAIKCFVKSEMFAGALEQEIHHWVNAASLYLEAGPLLDSFFCQMLINPEELLDEIFTLLAGMNADSTPSTTPFSVLVPVALAHLPALLKRPKATRLPLLEFVGTALRTILVSQTAPQALAVLIAVKLKATPQVFEESAFVPLFDVVNSYLDVADRLASLPASHSDLTPLAKQTRITSSLKAIIRRVRSKGWSDTLRDRAHGHLDRCIAQLGSSATFNMLPLLAYFSQAVVQFIPSSLLQVVEKYPDSSYDGKETFVTLLLHLLDSTFRPSLAPASLREQAESAISDLADLGTLHEIRASIARFLQAISFPKLLALCNNDVVFTHPLVQSALRISCLRVSGDDAHRSAVRCLLLRIQKILSVKGLVPLARVLQAESLQTCFSLLQFLLQGATRSQHDALLQSLSSDSQIAAFFIVPLSESNRSSGAIVSANTLLLAHMAACGPFAEGCPAEAFWHERILCNVENFLNELLSCDDVAVFLNSTPLEETSSSLVSLVALTAIVSDLEARLVNILAMRLIEIVTWLKTLVAPQTTSLSLGSIRRIDTVADCVALLQAVLTEIAGDSCVKKLSFETAASLGELSLKSDNSKLMDNYLRVIRQLSHVESNNSSNIFDHCSRINEHFIEYFATEEFHPDRLAFVDLFFSSSVGVQQKCEAAISGLSSRSECIRFAQIILALLRFNMTSIHDAQTTCCKYELHSSGRQSTTDAIDKVASYYSVLVEEAFTTETVALSSVLVEIIVRLTQCSHVVTLKNASKVLTLLSEAWRSAIPTLDDLHLLHAVLVMPHGHSDSFSSTRTNMISAYLHSYVTFSVRYEQRIPDQPELMLAFNWILNQEDISAPLATLQHSHVCEYVQSLLSNDLDEACLDLLHSMVRVLAPHFDNALALKAFVTLLSHRMFLTSEQIILSASMKNTVVPESVRSRVVDILLMLVAMHPSICDVAHFEVLLIAYNASLTLSDRLLLHLMMKYEELDLRCGSAGLVWGPSSPALRSQAKSQGLWRSQLGTAALSLIDDGRMTRTISSFPHLRTLEGPDRSLVVDDTSLYDPAFLTQLLIAIFQSDSEVSSVELIHHQLLSVCVLGLSASCPLLRAASSRALAFFSENIKSASFAGQPQLELVFWVLKNTITKPNRQLPSLTAMFIARSLRILLLPKAAPFYNLINSHFLKSWKLDLDHVPLAERLFKLAESREEVHWFLRFLSQGVWSSKDFYCLDRIGLIGQLMTFYHSERCVDLNREQILDLFANLSRVSTCANQLLRFKGFASWLLSAITSSKRIPSSALAIVNIIIANLLAARRSSTELPANSICTLRVVLRQILSRLSAENTRTKSSDDASGRSSSAFGDIDLRRLLESCIELSSISETQPSAAVPLFTSAELVPLIALVYRQPAQDAQSRKEGQKLVAAILHVKQWLASGDSSFQLRLSELQRVHNFAELSSDTLEIIHLILRLLARSAVTPCVSSIKMLSWALAVLSHSLEGHSTKWPAAGIHPEDAVRLTELLQTMARALQQQPFLHALHLGLSNVKGGASTGRSAEGQLLGVLSRVNARLLAFGPPVWTALQPFNLILCRTLQLDAPEFALESSSIARDMHLHSRVREQLALIAAQAETALGMAV
eukprot:m.858170 g.858170  ORF g.858170 m.858170 type:complete len:2285 (+) comp59654_c0_seq1:2-6856(+)